MSATELLEKLYTEFNLSSARERRESIISEMSSLESQSIDCRSCEGTCCTFQSNSMQVDPLEALEVYSWLEQNNLINDEVLNRIEDCIKEFRLDSVIYLGRGREVRRTYTCPFFLKKQEGCSLSRSVKPYGCLAFNPIESEISTGGSCRSNLQVLENREKQYSQSELQANEQLKMAQKLYWDKKPLPVALRDLHKSFKLLKVESL